jgi:hypothetical protein
LTTIRHDVVVKANETEQLQGCMTHGLPRILCLVLAAVFLIVGWWPFAPFPRNHVSWLPDGHGLTFGSPGVAYDVEPLPAPAAPPSDEAPGFAVELSLESGTEPDNFFPHILTIHDGRTPSSLIIGQWQADLLVRIPAPRNPSLFREEGIAGLQKGRRHLVIISSDAMATTFYIDGRLSRRFPGFVLEPRSMRGQLILGNAATGKSSWTGTLFGMAIFQRAIEAKEVAAHQAIWAEGAARTLARQPELIALYDFGDGTGQQARDYSPSEHHLFIPSRYVVLQKTVLGASGNALPRGWSAAEDLVLNLLGFVPFGFLAFLYRRAASPARWLQAILISTLAGVTLSLVIEVGQVWLPTRDSSAIDLALNTAGTVIGVLLAAWHCRGRASAGSPQFRV